MKDDECLFEGLESQDAGRGTTQPALPSVGEMTDEHRIGAGDTVVEVLTRSGI